MHPTSIHITAVLVKWNTSTGRVQKGVATNWLAAKNPKGTVYILFNKIHQTLNLNLELHCVTQPNFSIQTLRTHLSKVVLLCTAYINHSRFWHDPHWQKELIPGYPFWRPRRPCPFLQNQFCISRSKNLEWFAKQFTACSIPKLQEQMSVDIFNVSKTGWLLTS